MEVVYGKLDAGRQLHAARMIAISANSSQIVLTLVHSNLLIPTMNSRVTTYIPNSCSQVRVRLLPMVDVLAETWDYGNRPRF